MDKPYKFSIWYVLIAVWIVLILQNMIFQLFSVERVPYSEFVKALQAGQYLLDIGMASQKDYSEKTAEVIDHEIKAIMDQQYQVAKKILTSHEKVLDEGAALVLKEENIEGDRLKKLLETEKAD
jgi:ATP-dependent Zn protease